MDKSFKDIRIVDNFYQSSSFFPMPLCLIGTLDENGTITSFGSYSLCFPYYIAGKGFYAMILECRNNSNTCKGLLRHGKCSINFLPFSKKNFCPLPTNWGYRDSKYFWCSDYKKPIPVGIPDKEVDLTSVKYAANRLNSDVKFTDDALKMLVKVPRPFLKLVLQGCVDWANNNNCKLITEKEMKIINDKRSKEKGKGK